MGDDFSLSTLLTGVGSGVLTGLALLLLLGAVPAAEGIFLFAGIAVFGGALSGGFLGGLVGLWALYRDWSRRTAMALAFSLPLALGLLLKLLTMALA